MADMIEIDCEQGTDEWKEIKRGVASASDFDKVVTTKGEYSKQAEKYRNKLIAEIVTGNVEDGYQNDDMERGIEMEDEAAFMYELKTGRKLRKVGFVFKDESRRVGCSPDRLFVGEHSGVEFKCPTARTMVEYLLLKKPVLPYQYFQQVQGSMWVMKMKTYEFCAYHPDFKPYIVRVEADMHWQDHCTLQMKKFTDEVAYYAKKLKKVA